MSDKAPDAQVEVRASWTPRGPGAGRPPRGLDRDALHRRRAAPAAPRRRRDAHAATAAAEPSRGTIPAHRARLRRLAGDAATRRPEPGASAGQARAPFPPMTSADTGRLGRPLSAGGRVTALVERSGYAATPPVRPPRFSAMVVVAHPALRAALVHRLRALGRPRRRRGGQRGRGPCARPRRRPARAVRGRRHASGRLRRRPAARAAHPRLGPWRRALPHRRPVLGARRARLRHPRLRRRR